MDQSKVLAFLASALVSVDGDSHRFNRVRALIHYPLSEVIDALSRLEHETSHPADVRLISMAKQVLAGKRGERSFIDYCNEVSGI